MRIFGYLAVGALGFGLAGIGAGCGGGDGNTGGGGSGTTSSTTSTTSTTSVTTTTSSTSGTMTGCSTSMSAPDPITLNDMNPTACTFTDPVTDANFFKFTGKKGQVIGIFTTAKTG
jgi:hypothetical protein